MARIKSFAAPHKGLRNVISRFSFTLGHTDWNSNLQLAQLKELGKEMFTLLNDHVHTEDEHTLRHLEQRAPGSSDHDKKDHEELEVIQNALEDQLAAFTGRESTEDVHAFYLEFSMFHSRYLEHIYHEETVTELLLQKHFTDEELISHRMQIMRSIQFPILVLWLKYIIPAQSADESLGMLAGLKASAPKEAYDHVLTVLKGEMPADRYEQLAARLQ